MEIDEECDNGSGKEEGDNENSVVPRDASLPEFQSIQHDDKVHLYNSSNGKQQWKCGWCNK
jgi:hypothetical protein